MAFYPGSSPGIQTLINTRYVLYISCLSLFVIYCLIYALYVDREDWDVNGIGIRANGSLTMILNIMKPPIGGWMNAIFYNQRMQ